jgi:hypothetical protein
LPDQGWEDLTLPLFELENPPWASTRLLLLPLESQRSESESKADSIKVSIRISQEICEKEIPKITIHFKTRIPEFDMGAS